MAGLRTAFFIIQFVFKSFYIKASKGPKDRIQSRQAFSGRSQEKTMKRILFLLLCVLLFRIGVAQRVAPQWLSQSSGTTARLRGVSAVNPTVAWASGSDGVYLKTTDGGETWRAATVPGAESLDFRDVHALDDRTAWLMSIGTGESSRIYR